MGLAHGTSQERVSSGVAELDTMLGGGYYRGSSVLVTGTAGTGKSSLSAHFANATCAKGERCLYFAFEESPTQIVRNMRTIGIDLQQWIDADLLQIHSTRPMHYGLEMHLATMQRSINRFQPQAVIVDPVTNFETIGNQADVNAMLIRLVDMLKARGITCFFVTLTSGGGFQETTDVGMSSLMDTWLLVRDIELNGERNRGFYVLKSRGMKHSNQIREFVITSSGIHLLEAYLGDDRVLTGSARLAQEKREQAARNLAREEAERQKALSERKRNALLAQIAALQSELLAEELLADAAAKGEMSREEREQAAREAMAKSRRMHGVGESDER
jgi:circadian clock protein KaiC